MDELEKQVAELKEQLMKQYQTPWLPFSPTTFLTFLLD